MHAHFLYSLFLCAACGEGVSSFTQFLSVSALAVLQLLVWPLLSLFRHWKMNRQHFYFILINHLKCTEKQRPPTTNFFSREATQVPPGVTNCRGGFRQALQSVPCYLCPTRPPVSVEFFPVLPGSPTHFFYFLRFDVETLMNYMEPANGPHPANSK